MTQARAASRTGGAGAGFRRARPLLLALVLLASAAPRLSARELTVERFDAELLVRRNGVLVVTERIRFHFQGSWNGIYRTIPIEYDAPGGLNYTLQLRLDGVTDDKGVALRYERSRQHGSLRLKVYVPGAHDAWKTVVIHYHVLNALRFFEDHDELYWNVTGTQWDVPIQGASVRLYLPPAVEHLRATGYTGVRGSREEGARETIDAPNSVLMETARPLGFHEGMTLVTGWDPGVVERPGAIDKAGLFLAGNWGLLLPFLGFGVMFGLWRRKGRDPRLRPITARYEPPAGLGPAEAGTLLDNRPDLRDITATLVDLAVRGFITIEERKESHAFGLVHKQEYVFHRAKGAAEWGSLQPHERALLASLFSGDAESIETSELANSFYKHLPEIRNGIFDRLVFLGYYRRRPDSVRVPYMTAGIVLAAGTFLGAAPLAQNVLGQSPLPLVIGGIATGVIVAFFGYFMPARTPAGARALEEVLGFEEFLGRVEGDRLRRMVRTPEMFEKYLPFAMAFAVEKSWARAFEDTYRTPPSWYIGTDPAGFRAGVLTARLQQMCSHTGSVMSSSPRSSSSSSGFGGGGFSGGGFGGGGGGGF